MRRSLLTFALICSLASCAFAEDSAVVLARILAEKGIISKADLARVESATDKGQAVTQVAAAALTTAPPPSTSQTTIAKPAPAAAPQPEKGAVSVYGTILWNSYLNTSLM